MDDTIQDKSAQSAENELICWHYDHSIGRSVREINLLNMLYLSGNTTIPVTFELIKKIDRVLCDFNELMQKMLTVCHLNQLIYRYILADNWFYSSANMRFIRLELNKHFIFTLKSNRMVALSVEDKKAGSFVLLLLSASYVVTIFHSIPLCTVAAIYIYRAFMPALIQQQKN